MIVYASKHGATADYARAVAAASGHAHYDVARDAKAAKRSLHGSQDERLLLVVPIYAGRVLGAMRRFVEAQYDWIMTREYALSIACLVRGAHAREQLSDALPAWLSTGAARNHIVGGRIVIADLTWWERLLLRRLGQTDDVDTVNMNLASSDASWLSESTGS